MKIELLAPAGSLECLKTAYYFGADAAYVGGSLFGLRAFASNFSEDEMVLAVELSKSLHKKLYVTLNTAIYSTQLQELLRTIRFLSDIGADAVILSDPSVLMLIRENNIPIDMHISTQANTTNYKSALFWHQLGAKRIVLSRELSLEDIRLLTGHIPDSLELEAFVHGAMCVAYSGRCLLSYALTGRSGNKGECAQPCRWEYTLHEKGYPEEYLPIMEDGGATYVMNSKDLMMIEHIPELIQSGITSFKIEGRMKSPYYVASTVNAYRRAIDSYICNPGRYVFDQSLKEELVKSATRPFSTGFYFGSPQQDTLKTPTSRQYSFVGMVTEDAIGGEVIVEQRNKFLLGDTLEVLSPNLQNTSFTIEMIRNQDGELQEAAPHPQQIVTLNCALPLQRGDILRKII